MLHRQQHHTDYVPKRREGPEGPLCGFFGGLWGFLALPSDVRGESSRECSGGGSLERSWDEGVLGYLGYLFGAWGPQGRGVLGGPPWAGWKCQFEPHIGGPSWDPLEPSWRQLGPSRGSFESSWGPQASNCMGALIGVALHCLALPGNVRHALELLGIVWHYLELLCIAWRCSALVCVAWHSR